MKRLAGQRVVVTRAAHQAEELARPLRELGAEVILLPMIAIVPPADSAPFRRALKRLDHYDWIIFTSANAVAAVKEELRDSSTVPRTRIAAIGNATRQAIENFGWKVDLVPLQAVAESLGAAFGKEDLRGKRILIPSAAVTRDVLPRMLADVGALVDVVEAYRNVTPDEPAVEAARIFSGDQKPDWVTFTSSSAVDALVQFVGRERLQGSKIACIGSITAATVASHGLSVHALPDEHSIAAMLQAMLSSG